jgi:hypothetical protein
LGQIESKASTEKLHGNVLDLNLYFIIKDSVFTRKDYAEDYSNRMLQRIFENNFEKERSLAGKNMIIKVNAITISAQFDDEKKFPLALFNQSQGVAARDSRLLLFSISLKTSVSKNWFLICSIYFSSLSCASRCAKNAVK